MQFMLLCNADSSVFDQSEVERVFRANPSFRDMRVNTPVGDLIASKYVDSDDWTLIHLNKDRQSIFLSGTDGAALRAVLAIQRGLGIPLRLYDNTYSFDLTFSNIATVDELEAAMDNSPTS
jgi:hypothetical protein